MMKYYLHVCAAALLCALPLRAENADADTHQVSKGDTLWDISGKYYGDKEQWPMIFEANKDIIKDPHWIYPGMKIGLPKNAKTSGQTEKPAPELIAAPLKAEDQPAINTTQTPAEEQVQDNAGPMAEEKVPDSIVPAKPAAQEPRTDRAKEEAIHFTTAQAGNDTDKIESSGVKTIISEKLDVANEMPVDVTWETPSTAGIIVSGDWKEDGYVRYTNPEDHEDDMAATGDIIELKLTSKTEINPGEIVGVYQRGNIIRDKKGNKTGMTIHRAALVKIREVTGSALVGEIVRMTNPVSKEDIFKKE